MEFTEQENKIIDSCAELFAKLDESALENKIEALNLIKQMLHEISPFKAEPVDCVTWVKHETVHANNYNPNHVNGPEIELLRLSIDADHYTQPVVSMLIDETSDREVIDGFHRSKICKENKEIRDRIYGYLPVVTINDDRKDKANRMASTVRHNRARGKHSIDKMSDIVIELKRRNWNDEKIAKHLGMDADEVLRLTQITGLADVFADHEFSQAWESDLSDNDVIEIIE